MTERANDRAWRLLQEEYGIVESVKNNGSFIITAEQIREFRKPRLMAKFDSKDDLPELFRQNNLSILPISRGAYIIGKFDPFSQLEIDYSSPIIHIPLPSCISSIDSIRICSESVALNAAFSSGIIADFLDEQEVYPTISGRQSSGSFSYSIETLDGPDLAVDVSNAQIEINAGFEGMHSLALFEAKLNLCEEFPLRQLYYPFRAWRDRTAKLVRPVLLAYANKTFHCYEFTFSSFGNYSTGHIARKARYSIEPATISFDEIQEVFNRTKCLSEPNVPFPQANSMERILNLCERLDFRNLEQREISETYDFASRQAHYYSAAAEYLGLVEKKPNGQVILSDFGIDYLEKSHHDAQLFICERIFEHRPFNETFGLIVKHGMIPQKETVAAIIEKYTQYTGSTPLRRASTVQSWMKWICNLMKEEA